MKEQIIAERTYRFVNTCPVLSELPPLSKPRSFSIFDDEEYLKSTILVKDSEYLQKSAQETQPQAQHNTDENRSPKEDITSGGNAKLQSENLSVPVA